MAVVSEDFLSLAKELSHHNTEICWRSAVSRAYYCIYHECQPVGNTLPEAPYDSDPKGIHDRFIKKFTAYEEKTPFKMKIRSIGHMLRCLKDMRVEADYEIDHDFRQTSVQEVFQYIEKIRHKLNEVSQLQPEKG